MISLFVLPISKIVMRHAFDEAWLGLTLYFTLHTVNMAGLVRLFNSLSLHCKSGIFVWFLAHVLYTTLGWSMWTKLEGLALLSARCEGNRSFSLVWAVLGYGKPASPTCSWLFLLAAPCKTYTNRLVYEAIITTSTISAACLPHLKAADALLRPQQAATPVECIRNTSFFVKRE